MINEIGVYTREVQITPKITLRIPTVGEIIDFGEERYYSVVTMLSSTSYQMRVLLDDAGVDFTTISDFQLFQNFFLELTNEDVYIVLPGIDPRLFVRGINSENGEEVLVNKQDGIVIDKFVYEQMADVLRKINGFKKEETKSYPDKQTQKWIIERDRLRQERQRKSQDGSMLESMIIALVNCRDFKYNYDDIKNVSIFNLNQSIHQIERYLNYILTMVGIYSGCIDSKQINIDDIKWLV